MEGLKLVQRIAWGYTRCFQTTDSLVSRDHTTLLAPTCTTTRSVLVFVLFVIGWASSRGMAAEHESLARSPDGSTKTTSMVSRTGMPEDIVPHGAMWNFGAGALQTYRGWQYAAFWDSDCQVSVARRELPAQPWQCVSLGGYQRTSDRNRGNAGAKSRGFGDGHEKVVMGISSDGVIHLAFDHHVSTLHYRFSRPGVANDPSKFDWDESLFSPVQDHLGGPKIESVTYPSFVRDGDRMTLSMRLNGGSGSADSHFFEYRGGAWTINDPQSSKLVDKHWSGGDGTVNAYFHTMFVHQGRRHLTWCWRDTPDASTCHDLCYAYSDDHGQTWRNHSGDLVGRLGVQYISADTPGISVLKIPPGSTYVNGGSMTVDSAGDVHVLMRGPRSEPLMARRRATGGTWLQSKAPTTGVLVAQRSRLYVVAETGLYETGLYETVPHGAKQTESGEASRNFVRIGDSIERDCIDSHFVVDAFRHHVGTSGQDEPVISLIGQHGTRVNVIDFAIHPGTGLEEVPGPENKDGG